MEGPIFEAWMAETLRLAVMVMMVIMMAIKTIMQFFIDSSSAGIALSLGAGRSGDPIPVGARFSTPVQTCSGG